MPDTTVGSAGDGAPPSAREPRLRPRRLPTPINGGEQFLAAILDELVALRHEVAELRLDKAGLDQVKEGDPVLELIEPATPAPRDPSSAPEPVELAEPAPGPARPTKKAAAKKAPAKKAAPRP